MSRRRLDRRSFLQTGVPFALALPGLAYAQTLVERGRFTDEQLPLAREQLLKKVNGERAAAGLTPLQLDDLASRVANDHAHDMAEAGFLNHIGSDGRTPYHRYSFAGGMAAVQENVSAAEDIESVSPLRVLHDLDDMHQSMMDEKPPNDGHRRAILFPFHTHVGFGIALRGHSLRLDELYLARYAEFEPLVTTAAPKSTVVLAGRLLPPARFLNNIDVCFEPLPEPRTPEWLRSHPSAIALPDINIRLRPRLPDGFTYPDNSSGDYDWSRDGKFRVRVRLAKSEPGIYTIVFWMRRVPADKGFPGAQVCILSQRPQS
jgi:uncharacterized protein YkwD